jgi:predicted PurR-regulated permease PerM
VPVRIGSILFDIILVVFVSIYWLLAMPAMPRFILSPFPEERHQWIAGVWRFARFRPALTDKDAG